MVHTDESGGLSCHETVPSGCVGRSGAMTGRVDVLRGQYTLFQDEWQNGNGRPTGAIRIRLVVGPDLLLFSGQNCTKQLHFRNEFRYNSRVLEIVFLETILGPTILQE